MNILCIALCTLFIINPLASMEKESAFCRKLIDKAIELSDTVEEWKLSPIVQQSLDGKYYIDSITDSADTFNQKIVIYNAQTQTPFLEIPGHNNYILFKGKNLLLMQPSREIPNEHKNLMLCDLDTGTQYQLMNEIENIPFDKKDFAQLSPDENCIAIAHNNKIVTWDITNLHSIAVNTYKHNGVKYFAFSPDNTLFASSSSDENPTDLFLWKRTRSILTLINACYKNIPHNCLSFIQDNTLFLGNKSTENPHCQIITLKSKDGNLEKYIHVPQCRPLILQLYAPVKDAIAGGSTLVVEQSENRLEKNSNTSTCADHLSNTHTLYKNQNDYFHYRISITPNGKIVALVLGKNENNIPQQKVILMKKNKVITLRDWSPSSSISPIYEHESIIAFNATSQLYVRGITTEKKNTIELYSIKGKRLRTFDHATAQFHPDGRSLIDYGKRHILYTKELAELIYTHNNKACTPDTYHFLKDVCLERKELNNNYLENFNKFSPEEQTTLINSYKLNIPHPADQRSWLPLCTIS